MSAWTRYPSNWHGLDSYPIHAALMKEIVRGDLDHLARQPSVGCGFFFVNTVPSSTQTVYNNASTIYRPNLRKVNPAIDRELRRINVKIQAYMSAGAGSLRVCLSPSWRIVASTPADGDQEVRATNAVVSTSATAPTIVTLSILPRLSATFPCTYGLGGDAGRGELVYRATFLSVQAIQGAANTVYVQAMCISEADSP